jgi:hypothetical protein
MGRSVRVRPAGRAANRAPLRSVLTSTIVAVVSLNGGCQVEPQPRDLAQAVDDAMSHQPASFVSPDAARRAAIAVAVEALLKSASPRIPQGYEQARLHDSGGPLIGLLEVGEHRRGDGLFVVRSKTRAPLIIEAPHPGSDQSTELIAAALFSASAAEALLVAGSRRDAGPGGSADAAHADSTAFASVDRRLSVHGTTVVQIHGFATANHPGYPQVVLSDTTPTPAAWVSVLAGSLEQEGFSTCVFDGSVCRELGATRNVEADHARASGARFVHVEIDDSVRQSPEARRRVSAALARGLRLVGRQTEQRTGQAFAPAPAPPRRIS